MADDVAAWVPDEQLRFDANPTGVAECLVNTDRRIVSWGMGHVDDPNAITTSLVRQIHPKCMPLEIALVQDEGSLFAKTGNVQGGFIRRDPAQESPAGGRFAYSVYSITAKHNLRRVADSLHHVHRPYMANFKVPGGLVRVNSPDLDWVPTAAHACDLRAGALDARPAMTVYGVDISVGELITHPSNQRTILIRQSSIKLSVQERTKGWNGRCVPQSRKAHKEDNRRSF